MSYQRINEDFAAALGLPKNTRRAVLTLEAGELPTLDITVYCTDALGHLIVERDADDLLNSSAKRVASVQFKVRLEPFEPTP